VKRWRVEKIENEGQDAIKDEISKLARAFMRKSFLLPHQEHAVKEFDIGLWQLAQEYTQRRGKSLVRIYKCPMWNRYNCSSRLRIQEGPFGLIMESLGSQNADSHLEHGETGSMPRFIKGNQLFREEDIPEVVAIREELERANPEWKTEPIRVTPQRMSNDGSNVCESYPLLWFRMGYFANSYSSATPQGMGLVLFLR
jgi:hypothetical protein